MECACCKITHEQFFTIDHINGGGNAHRKSLGSWWRFYRSLKEDNFPAGYQVLCFNCNKNKGTKPACDCPYDFSTVAPCKVAV